MKLKSLGRARHLALIPGLVVLAAPALADQRLPPPTLVRVVAPSGAIRFGEAVAGVGDVNADGVDDVLVGAPGSGHVYVVSGSGAILRDISVPSTLGLQFGAALAAIGDVDRDRVRDFVVGAPPERSLAGACPSSPQCAAPGPSRGRAFVFSGVSGAMLWELLAPATAGAQFGRSVTGADDLSGDGVPDIVVGAPGQMNGPGTILGFSGANGAPLWFRPDSSPSFGELVVSTPDVSGDGIADVLAWSPTTSAARLPAGGAGQLVDTQVRILAQVPSPLVPDRVHILSGATGAVVRIHSDPAPTGNDAFGATMAHIGDQDGDGVVDHLIGEEGANQLHAYSGRTGVLIRSIAAPVSAQGRGRFALARVDDKDGDGRDDFWVGVGSARTVYLVNGLGTVLGSAAGPSAQGAFGTAIGTVGNLGGDPGPDLVVGDPAEAGGGAAYLLYIGSRALPAAPAQFGKAAGCSGAACEGILRVQAQTTAPTTTTTAAPTTTTTTVPSTTTTAAPTTTTTTTTIVPDAATTLPDDTTTVPTTSAFLMATTSQATMDGAPATASLPKPASATMAEGGLPNTGAVDRSVAGLAALGLGMTGIAFLRRLREPRLRPPPSTD